MPQRYNWRFDRYPVTDELPVAAFNEDSWFITNTSIPFFHFHDTLEITYWIEGSGCFVISGTEYPVSAGDLCVICPNTLHYSYNRSKDPSRCKYLYIDLDRFSSMSHYGFHGLDLLKNHTPGFCPLLTVERFPDAVPVLLLIFEEIEKKAQNWQASVLSLVGLLVNQILRAQDPGFLTAARDENSFPLAPALDMIRERYADGLTTSELAKSCHMSETSFRRIFSKVLSMSPMQYLRQIRIQKACEQLMLTSDTVSQIADRVGFGSVSTFNRDFKETMRISPSNWRSIHQK